MPRRKRGGIGQLPAFGVQLATYAFNALTERARAMAAAARAEPASHDGPEWEAWLERTDAAVDGMNEVLATPVIAVLGDHLTRPRTAQALEDLASAAPPCSGGSGPRRWTVQGSLPTSARHGSSG